VANNRRRKDVYRLPQADQEILEDLGYKQKLDEVDQAIMANAAFLGQIVANPEIFGHDIGADDDETDASHNSRHDKARSPGVAEQL
jgi:carnosine N-methyltransferase